MTFITLKKKASQSIKERVSNLSGLLKLALFIVIESTAPSGTNNFPDKLDMYKIK